MQSSVLERSRAELVNARLTRQKLTTLNLENAEPFGGTSWSPPARDLTRRPSPRLCLTAQNGGFSVFGYIRNVSLRWSYGDI